MPKPMIRTSQSRTQAREDNILSASYDSGQQKQKKQMDKMMLDRLLRQPRSKKYMDAMHKLDAGGHVHNQDKVDEIINAIKDEFPEVELQGILLGCVSICYLGRPYEVHSINYRGGIIEHYKAGHVMPGGLEKARSIALRGGYDFIEVYADCCRAVNSDGSVSVIPC
jgi:hypothetical protein